MAGDFDPYYTWLGIAPRDQPPTHYRLLGIDAFENNAEVIENAAESALEHHLGMTCDPVAGYVQVPCIERCAFGAVKAWIAFMIATNEIASRHRVDLDTTIKTLADTGRDMSAKYKETSEAGLAANLVLC